MRPEEVVAPGDEIMVMVKEFDLDRKRISLSIKDAEGDPWADIEEKFKPGRAVQGRVEKKGGLRYLCESGSGHHRPASLNRRSLHRKKRRPDRRPQARGCHHRDHRWHQRPGAENLFRNRGCGR
jgi:transcriptional accessory protein Tex/SPT6